MESIVIILNYLFIVICLIGLTGNFLSLIIFSRKKFQNTIFSTYFRLLAIFDLLTLSNQINHFLFVFKEKIFSSESSFKTLSEIHIFLYYIFPNTSIWISVLISIDRFVSITMSTKFLFRKTIKFQLIACLVVFILISIIYVPLVIMAEFPNVNYTNSGSIYLKKDNNVLDILDLSFSCLLAFNFMLLTNILTLRSIFKSRRKARNPNTNGQSNNQTNKRDIRFAITSISMNISFFIANFPISFYLVLKLIIKIEFHIVHISIFSILMGSHFGSMFYVLIFINSTFRKEFILFFSDCKIMLINFKNKF